MNKGEMSYLETDALRDREERGQREGRERERGEREGGGEREGSVGPLWLKE